ncbi:MAG: cytochrome P450 [Actinomycetota bacterium]|nr:cytochrome P450 [Acidimicrobiia bacterium]MDQ3293713.1 cytochrome P450 [Actinomycetota bacterium]
MTATTAIDILDPRLYDDPWETYRWLRNEAPVWWDAKNELWVLSKHEDVSHVSRHAPRYSAAQGVRPVIAAPMSIITMDDPEHTRQRRLVNKGFTPRRVRELADHIRELSNDIIDGIAESGECDFVEDIARHVPLIVIAEMMGLDPGDRDRLYQWSEAMMAGDGHVEADSPELHAAAVAFGEFATVAFERIAARRAEPSDDDIIGILTHAFDEGELAHASEIERLPALDELTDDDLLLFLVLLTVAGNETTRNALSGGLLAFSLFPDQRDKLIANPDLIDLAVDEIVRYVSPVLTFCRTVTETHEYKGHTFEAGQKVLMLYQSANRDEDVFDGPDDFRIDRDPNPHLGFGIGTHYCLGANLARAEIKVVFEELFGRLSDIRVPDGATLQRGDSSLVLALQHLPAVFTPAQKLAG